MCLIFSFHVFWGVDYEFEIGLWRSASEILFFQIVFGFLIENDNGGSLGNSVFFRVGGAPGGVNRKKIIQKKLKEN